MTAGFGADPAHDFRSGAIICFLCLALLSAPAYLTMFRWCGVGEITMWSVTGMSFAVLLVAGVLLHFLGFVVLLAVESLIFNAIASGSRKSKTEHPE
jgi:hypothetical protein